MNTQGDTRVLVLAPTSKDFELLQQIFARHDIEGFACASLARACADLDAHGAGVLIASEEALAGGKMLVDWLERQPPWSDLPILILARPGADSNAVAATAQSFGNATILERPMRVATIVSSVQSALRARNRQYQIRGLLADNEQSETELRANDKRKDEFLAILAHELRNPLAPISNGLQILNLALDANPETAAIGEMMQRQIGNMKRLVDDLLEVSRVTRGELELRIDQVELSRVVNAAIESSQPLLAASQHRLNVFLPQQPVYFQADAVRLAQVISNLLNNAAKYTLANGDITLSVDVTDAEIVIRVSDNGVGIPRELQPKIFDMFMQVDRNRSTAQGGLGIGLTLVKRLVELHGGNIEVASEGRDAGSEFTIRLPRGTAMKSIVTPVSTATKDLSRLNILVADDNEDAADSLGLLLRHFNAKVRVTYDGKSALDVLDLPQTHAAILDIGMNDMDGLEVARRIRRRTEGEKILLIALTGWGQQQDILNTRIAGFDHHLTKPVDFDQLLTLLTGL
ncbi:MAG: ATP-binding protein [Spongiibacteraceae bacterium]